MPRRVDRIHTGGHFDTCVAIALMRAGFEEPGKTTLEEGIRDSLKFIEELNKLYHDGRPCVPQPIYKLGDATKIGSLIGGNHRPGYPLTDTKVMIPATTTVIVPRN